MATTRTKAVTVSLKLLIDTDAKRVLFAEAGEDFVDFLRNLLALPVGPVIRILNNRSMRRRHLRRHRKPESVRLLPAILP
ncbi:hypothetical protein RHMOL_Rhmol09G0219200 [Rhododendron molle]|uniref:Uncharacterized protein n=1 Tax=Rhododendron molle TaxID=49168 RepID=A0ACC0MFS8_RHOML|nr:hypothetical protein RHMOL_Rhmol09G0219200 [Rhododendron molle]